MSARGKFLRDTPNVKTKTPPAEAHGGRAPMKIDRLFVVLPQSRQTARFDQLSQLRWLYRLALGQPHQQAFIEAMTQLPDDGRQEYALSLSAWPRYRRQAMEDH
jgi:hypothetical protein